MKACLESIVECIMAMIAAVVLCVFLLVAVHCQPYPRFEFNDTILVNNSYIHRDRISKGKRALKCVTDNRDCCTDPVTGNWTDRNGAAVHRGMAGANTVYITRGSGVVSLNRKSGGTLGIWRCDIPDSSGVMQSIYICNAASGESYLLYISKVISGAQRYIAVVCLMGFCM